MRQFSESALKKAGITIRERKLSGGSYTRIEYQVVDGRKIACRHVMFVDALKAANELVQAEH